MFWSQMDAWYYVFLIKTGLLHNKSSSCWLNIGQNFHFRREWKSVWSSLAANLSPGLIRRTLLVAWMKHSFPFRAFQLLLWMLQKNHEFVWLNKYAAGGNSLDLPGFGEVLCRCLPGMLARFMLLGGQPPESTELAKGHLHFLFKCNHVVSFLLTQTH